MEEEEEAERGKRRRGSSSSTSSSHSNTCTEGVMLPFECSIPARTYHEGASRTTYESQIS